MVNTEGRRGRGSSSGGRGRSGGRSGGGRSGGGRPGGRPGGRGGGKSGGGAPIEPLHPTSSPPEIESFDEWELSPGVLQAIEDMGITTPTPIQALAIGPLLERRDAIAKAETGTGKTLAFGAPMMSMVDAERVSVLGLVLCPTRELAEQVAKVLELLGKPRGLKVALIVGGEPAGPQVEALQSGSQVVVGTPGRVLDLYKQRFLSFPWTEFVVLDEADEMLEIGFIDDVKEILSYTPEERQTLLFSATFPPPLLKLAREHTKNPVEIATASGISTVDNITQDCIVVDDADRALALIRMIEQSADDDVLLIFCDRRTEVERLMRRLERLPYSIKALHGGYDQASRFRVMSAFREGDVKALVATDVASRGLDVKLVTRVVNFNVPRDVTQYTHRIGRTGRAGREGRATTIVSHDQMRRWKALEREMNWAVGEVDAPGASRRRGPARERSDSRGRDRDRRRDEPRDEAREPRAGRGGRRGEGGGSRAERSAGREGRGRDERGPRREPERARGDRPHGREEERVTTRFERPSDAPSFGAGALPEREPRPARRQRGRREDPQDERQRPSPQPAPQPRPEREAEDGGSGFGAGV